MNMNTTMTLNEQESLALRLALREWRDALYERGHRGMVANHMQVVASYEAANAVRVSRVVAVGGGQ